jgi:hypothetical protein
MKHLAIVFAAALALAGCGPDFKIPAADFDFASVTLGQDNYCELAKRRTWHPDDTTETINGLRAENRKWTCLCTEQKGTPACRKYQRSASIIP